MGGMFTATGDIVIKGGALNSAFTTLLLSCLLSAQAPQTPPSRAECSEWDHQMALWDEAVQSQNYAEAERVGRRSLEIVDELHLDDGKRATSLSSTADSLRYQKKYEEAEPLFREALAIREKVLPPIHKRTAFTLQGLAASLVDMNRPNEAEPYFLRALAIWDHVGKDDYDSCRHGGALDGLGRVYFRGGDYEKAEPLYQRALSISMKDAGNCTVTVAAMNDLAAVYWAQGKLDRCEELYQATIPIAQRELGHQSELVAVQQARLARVYMAREKNAEAVELLKQAIPVLRRSGPSEKDLLMQSLINQASLLRRLHREVELPKVQSQIDAIQRSQSQSTEPLTRWQGLMAAMNHTTNVAHRTTLLEEALIEAEILGSGPELAQTLEMLGAEAVGTRSGRAEPYLKRALSVNEQVFGDDSKRVANVLDTLAVVLSSEKKYDEAEASLRREVSIFERNPERQVELIIAEQHLADLYNTQRQYAEAEPLYLRLLQAGEESPGSNDELVISTVGKLALLYKTSGRYEQAVEYLARAITMKELRSSLDPSLPAYLEMLSELLRKLNRPEEAAGYDEHRKQLMDLRISRGADTLLTK